MKTYREFINEIATQSTIIPKFDLRTPQTQTQTQSSKPVTRPSLMQQAQDLRAMRLRAIERQGGREDEAQRLRDQLSSAEQKVSDTRAAEFAKLRQDARDQTIARSQNPVRNRTNTSNTTNTTNTSNTANNNNNTGRNDTRIAQANTVGGANVRRGYLSKPTGSIQGYTGIDRDKLNQAMDAETQRLNDLNRRRTDMETRNQQNPPPPQTPRPQTPTQTPQTQTPQTQTPEEKPWWQKWRDSWFGGDSDTKTQPDTKPDTNTQPNTQPTQPQQPTQPSGNLTPEQQKQMDDAWKNRGTYGKAIEDHYNSLSEEDKRRFREYSKSKGYNWQFYN